MIGVPEDVWEERYPLRCSPPPPPPALQNPGPSQARSGGPAGPVFLLPWLSFVLSIKERENWERR